MAYFFLSAVLLGCVILLYACVKVGAEADCKLRELCNKDDRPST